MLVATLEQERKKIYQQGKDAGVAEGEAAGLIKGEAAGLRQTLLKLLHHRFGLNEAAQVTLAEQLAKISELQALNALTDHGLQAATFEEFATQLQEYLPTDRVG